eukprot:m.181902 g.181902  ORF g.181902 m.181902 type:complete len:54 (-) comp16636_c0_seq3:67-228(-)
MTSQLHPLQTHPSSRMVLLETPYKQVLLNTESTEATTTLDCHCRMFQHKSPLP